MVSHWLRSTHACIFDWYIGVFYLHREADMEESEVRVGFVTYAKQLHFYNVKVSVQSSKAIGMLSISWQIFTSQETWQSLILDDIIGLLCPCAIKNSYHVSIFHDKFVKKCPSPNVDWLWSKITWYSTVMIEVENTSHLELLIMTANASPLRASFEVSLCEYCGEIWPCVMTGLRCVTYPLHVKPLT